MAGSYQAHLSEKSPNRWRSDVFLMFSCLVGWVLLLVGTFCIFLSGWVAAPCSGLTIVTFQGCWLV